MPFEADHVETLKASMAEPGSWGLAQAPSRWAQTLQKAELPTSIQAYDKPLSRGQLRRLCRNPEVDVLVAYLCVMAWGGQRRNHARTAWNHRASIRNALIQLREHDLSHVDAFNLFSGTNAIPSLGVAFFTKLIFFFRMPKPGYFILDQWTGRSMNILCGHEVIPLDAAGTVSRRTTAEAYQEYCRLMCKLSEKLCIPPNRTEQLLLSEGGRNPKPWRQHVLQWGLKTPSGDCRNSNGDQLSR